MRTLGSAAVLLAAAIFAPCFAQAQGSLAPLRASGQSVTPAYEGWYKNPNGTYSLSFGYFNRNTTEVVEIPIGPENNVSPGVANQGQPSSFEPRRHWGVFTIVVPANFDKRAKVIWTLKSRGEEYAIPGSLDPLWEIDALEGEAGANNTPPVIQFSEAGAGGRGPGGVSSGPLTATVGTPLSITVWARDDGRGGTAGRSATPLTVTWIKHQGPGNIAFEPATGRVPIAGGSATAVATFSKPGEYMVRVRVNDVSGVSGAGHEQCCWTNGFVRVTVR
jgi:hypothetical protein